MSIILQFIHTCLMITLAGLIFVACGLLAYAMYHLISSLVADERKRMRSRYSLPRR
jgi:hypothetical protein